MSRSKRTIAALALLGSSALLSACASTVQKLEQVGQVPPHAPIENPIIKPNYEPVSMPMPAATPPAQEYAGSLWQPGARAFFRDQRASRVGDILRVKILIKDKAEVDNETERQRDSADSVGIPSLFGIQNRVARSLNRGADPANLVDVSSNTNSTGTGSVKRQEKIETQVAALVTQVLPNGNLVIDGKQEITVNYDIREVAVKGVVRPQDINSDNTVDSTQIAEARITYGGRGQLMDMQQPRWGNQVVDILSPF